MQLDTQTTFESIQSNYNTDTQTQPKTSKNQIWSVDTLSIMFLLIMHIHEVRYGTVFHSEDINLKCTRFITTNRKKKKEERKQKWCASFIWYGSSSGGTLINIKIIIVIIIWIEFTCCGRCACGRWNVVNENMLLATGYELILKWFSISIRVLFYFSFIWHMLFLSLSLWFFVRLDLVRLLHRTVWIGLKALLSHLNWPRFLSHNLLGREFLWFLHPISCRLTISSRLQLGTKSNGHYV